MPDSMLSAELLQSWLEANASRKDPKQNKSLAWTTGFHIFSHGLLEALSESLSTPHQSFLTSPVYLALYYLASATCNGFARRIALFTGLQLTALLLVPRGSKALTVGLAS